MMPRKRPLIPPATAPKIRAQFAVADEVSQRGWANALVWPDTGVLLVIGSRSDLPERFRGHYKNRVRIAQPVDRELRGLSNRQEDSPPEAYNRSAAAALAVRNLLVAQPPLQVVELTETDLPNVDLIREQLKGLSGDASKKHGGEAAVIVLSSRFKIETGKRQIFLSNDGAASVVARQHGIPTRHAGDVIAEISCADSSLGADECLSIFRDSLAISSPPAHCRPTTKDAFECDGNEDNSCPKCDGLD
jgi:hypothetical protein